MRGVLLLLLLTLFAVCSVPAAQHVYGNDYENDGKELMPDEENEKNSSPNLDDYDHTFQPSTSLPDADEFEVEATTDFSDGDDSFTQPDSVDSENTTMTYEENGRVLPQARNLDGNENVDIDNSSVASLPYTEEEEFGAVQDNKPRRTQPRKEPGSCGPPPFFERTTIASGKNSTYGPGSVVTYSCQFGYVSDGLRQVKCTQSEDSGELEWSQSQIRCTPRSCGDPGYVDHGNRIGSLFTFPNRVSFECEDGYELKGNSARYCQPSGTWSGKLPKCQKLSCKPPPDIQNGKVSYTSLEYGSELRYTCDPGFILKKHHSRYCAGNRTWSGEDPVCKDAQCDLPVAPKDGSFQLIGDKPIVDTRVIFKCDGNKILSGNRVSICMENGEWTFPPPKCIDPCSIPRVPNGKIKKYTHRGRYSEEVPVGSIVDNHDTLYLTCDKNYEPLGKQEKEVIVKCTNGAWEDPPRCEPASCQGEYPRTRNGFETRINRKNGGYVWYGCLPYFRKAQTGNITCNSGTWIGITPVCSDTRCYFSKLPLNGLIKQRETFYHTQSFTPACEKKYTLTKSDIRLRCENGEWKGHLPPCMPARCKTQPPRIDHGRVKSHSEDHSSVVEYECEEGFTLKDQKSSKVECIFGEWTGTPPKCQDSRCYYKDLKTNGLEIHDGFTPSGKYATVKCAEGFTPVQNAEPYCSEGVWEHPISPCKENSCTSSKIQNGGFHQKKIEKRLFRSDKVYFEKVALNGIYKPGDILFVICESQFTFQGKGGNTVEVKCSEGQWQPAPVCFITGTPYPDKPKQEQQSKRPERVTSRPNVASPTSIGTPGPDEVCSCTYINLDSNLVGFSGNELLEFGKKVKKGCRVKFYCRQFGYKILIGTPELVCDRCQDWHSSEYPQCIDPSVGDVVFQFSSETKISGVDEITLHEAESLDIYCFSYYYDRVQWERVYSQYEPIGVSFWPHHIVTSDGYSLPASVLRVTAASVQSSGVYRCFAPTNRPRSLRINVTVVECPLIEESEDISVNYEDGQKVNSRVIFSCKKEGARLVGDQVLTCQSNGWWSGEIPRCNQPVLCPELEKKEGITVDYTNDRYVGSTAAFHCFAPRKRIGESHARCTEDGAWSNPVPLCLLPNCSLDALFRSFPEDVTTDNEERKSDAMPYNSTVTLRCKDENHLLLGGSEATCKEDGNWMVSNLRCISGCAPPQPPDDYLIVEPSQSSYGIGDGIVLSCPAGMELSSDVVRLMCLHEGWSETRLPSCLLLKN